MQSTIVIALTLLGMAAHAQFPPGPGGPPPGMIAGMKVWQQWGSRHKNVMAVQQMLRGVEAMEQDSRTWLSRPQARTILSILHQWSSRPVMTNSQAAQVLKQTSHLWTGAQTEKIAAAGRRQHGSFGGPGPGRMGAFPPPPGMGGPPPPGMGGPPPPGAPGFGGFAKMPKPHEYNPLNPATLPFLRIRGMEQQHLAALVATLERTAKQ
jgi:hypothetical protein